MFIDSKARSEIEIGRIGENEARKIVFHIGNILKDFPDASFTLMHKRPGDEAAYPVNSSYIEIEENTLFWTVQSGDLTEEGIGYCELKAEQDSAIVKTEIYKTRIRSALDDSEDPPEPWESWIEEVTGAAEQAEQAVEHYPKIVDGYWAFWDNETEDWVVSEDPSQGEKGDDGDPGHTPVITGSKSGKTSTITADGETIATILDGEDGQNGQDGQDGQDGYSPSANVSKSGSTTTITITDANGTTTADVLDGDPSDLIDDTAGDGDTDKTWSADKLVEEFGDKADKVSSAVSGNFAGLDSNGNLTDSGSKASDFLTSHQDISGKADKVSGAVSGNFAGLDSNGNLTDSGHKHSDYLTSHQDISGKADKVSSATNGHVAALDGNGNLTDSGYTIGKSVPSDAVFTDTTYSAATQSAAGLMSAADKTALDNNVITTETVTGTTPSITGVANHRYVCGTCSTLSITPPASGMIDVIFESGTTATALTVPNTVKFPAWFDPTDLDASCTYEINILDGVYGAVMAWA